MFFKTLKSAFHLVKRHHVLTAVVVLLLILLATQLEKMRLTITKVDEPTKTGSNFHLPSADFFEKPVPESLKEPKIDENPEADPYNVPGRRIADEIRAPPNLHPARKVLPQAPPAAKRPLPKKPERPNVNPRQISANKMVKPPGREKTKDDEDELTFAAKMIVSAKQRQYSRRYQYLDVPDTVYKTLHDITHLCPEGDPPIKFSKWFNTFCWFENECGCHEEPSMIRCLPKFHLIGFPKAGTTDLFRRLMMHPQVLHNKKETNYWSVIRFIELANETELIRGNDTMALFTEDHIVNLENATVNKKGIEPYLDFYNSAMNDIEREYSGDFGSKERNPSKKVLGEGSVTYAYSSLGLRITIGKILNKSPMEVDCTIPRVIRYVTPDARIIVLLRNPVERLYSDYRNLFNALPADNKTAADFHERVVNRIYMWNKCIALNSEDYCVNSPQFEAVAVHSAIIGLVRSMYVIHLQKWLKEFPRQQIYMVHFEERIAEPERIIKDILRFLELEPISSTKLSEIANTHIPMYESGNAKGHQAGYGKGPMWESTRSILEDFYRPYNKRLAELLQDDKYLWYDSESPLKIPKRSVK